jgi:hypothetical protein
MSIVQVTRNCALMFALSLGAACSGSDSSGSNQEDLPADVSIRVGQKGGTLKASGMTLEIPAGALVSNIEISAKNAGHSAPKDIKAAQVSDLFEFGPAGTKFIKDVKITFHTEKSEPRGEVYFTKEDGSGFEKIASQKNGQQVTALVKHFSQGFVGVPLEEELDAGVEESDAGAEDAGEPVSDMDTGPELSEDAMLGPSDAGAAPDPDAAAPVDAAADALGDAGVDAAVSHHVVVNSRDRFGVLVNQTWAAFQDGQGAWQPLLPSSKPGVYELDVTSESFGVAFVCSSVDMVDSWGTLSLEPSTTTLLDVVTQGTPCSLGVPKVAHTMSGTLNFGTSAQYYWREGHAHLGSAINYFGGSSTAHTVGDLRDNEPNDVLFAQGPPNAADAGVSAYAIDKFLVRRNVTLTANLTGQSFDLVKDGVKALGSAQAQVLNANDATEVDVRYLTRNTEDGLWINTALTSGSSTRVATFATLPEGIRLAGDRYFLVGSDVTSSAWRKASYATYATGNLSVMLPATFATGFSALSTPYLRPSYSFTKVAGASLYVFELLYSPVRSSDHSFTIEVDPAWLGSSSTQTLTFPDFSQVQGFQSAWVAPSLGSVSTKAAVHVWKADANGALKTESGQSATVPAL